MPAAEKESHPLGLYEVKIRTDISERITDNVVSPVELLEQARN